MTRRATEIGQRKVSLHATPSRLLLLSVMAGAFIALGGTLAVTVGSGFSGIQAAVARGLAFPIGLVLVVAYGAELFTGNNAMLIPAWYSRRIFLRHVAANWTLVWIGNFIGSMLLTLLLVVGSGLSDAEPFRTAIIATAQAKASLPWYTMLLRGIGANWLVCLAVWMAVAAKTFPGKVLACWIPVAAFVMLGYEHSVANMFFIPCGMLAGANVTLGALWTNLAIVTLGNIIGGALFVGLPQSWLHSIKK